MEEKISLNELQARFRTENIEALTTVTIRVEVAITRNQDEQGEPVQELNALLNVLNDDEELNGHAFLEPDTHLGSITLGRPFQNGGKPPACYKSTTHFPL